MDAIQGHLFDAESFQAPTAPKASARPTPVDPSAIEGTVVRQLAERGDWRLLIVNVGGQEQKWSGVMHRPPDGTTVRATGRYEPDRRGDGDVLRVESLVDVVPTTEIGLVEFIANLGVPGIKKGLAKRIVRHFGADTVGTLDAAPERIAEVLGKGGEEKAAKIAEEWAKKRALAATTMFLLEKGATPGIARKVVEKFEDRARWIVEHDPYRLTEIDGIGFAKADDLAIKVGLARDAIQRAQAALLHCLVVETFERGHTYTPIRQLVRGAAKLIEVSASALWSAASALEERGARLSFQDVDGERVAMLPGLERAEHRLATRIRALLDAEPKTWEPDKSFNASEEVAKGGPRALSELADEAIRLFEQKTGMTLADAQREAVHLAARHNILVLTGGPGTGKCLGRGTPVLMFDGSIRAVEDVRDGDLLMGPDSRPRRVTGTTAGRGPLYNIVPIKGDSWVCNDAHILTLVRSGTNQVRDIALSDWLRLSKGAKWRLRGKLFSVGVDFPERSTPIDPYVIGMWLGNGSRAAPRITTPYQEVVDYLRAAAHAEGCRVHAKWVTEKNCFTVALSKNLPNIGPKHAKRNPFADEFKALLRGGEKFIPDVYKVNSRENRMRLLAGLIDSDGSVTCGCIEICSKWQRLAQDIAYLARSIGMRVTMTTKDVTLEGWTEPRTYYRLMISGHLDEIPTIVPNRKVPPRQQIKNATRSGFDAVPIGDGDYFGFQLDGDGRFLLGDFTVTHNTAVTKAIITLFELGNVPVVMCAPTGRAAKRMNEATGHRAATIHRTLGYDPKSRSFLCNETNPIDRCGALLVDEASMMETTLAADLFGAIPDGARVVIIGDVDQLPSVGPGAVLRDVITSGSVPTVRLTQIFRQAKGSEISIQAQRVNAGKVPIGQPGPEGEFFTVARDSGADAADAVLDIVTRRIPSRFGISPRDVYVLAPMYRGKAGIDALNRRLQDALNPLPVGGEELVRGKAPDLTRFRVGDRVLQTKNDPDRDVFNGDLGVVTAIATTEPDEKGRTRKVLMVAFDGERIVSYEEGRQLDKITLAYAMSIHKSQGASLDAVVVVMLDEHYVMLSRSLLYTALTRARRLAVLVSSLRATSRAVSEARREERRTLLAKRMESMAA